jgi:hypothetical protein
LKKPRHNRWKNLELRKLKPINAQHLTSFSKINSNKEHFRTLNHHQRMEIALIKKSSRTKLSTRNPQQPTAARIQRNRNRRKINTEKQEVKRKTHLTVIGVCTTIRPENSGT